VRENSGDIRPEAIRLLLLIGSTNAESILLDALADTAADLRVQTVEVIASSTRLAAPFLTTLLDMLQTDPEPSVRAATLKALDSIEPNSERVTLAKLGSIRDSSAAIRKLAATLLRELGPVPTVPALQQALRDQDAAVRAEVAKSLSQIGLRRKDAVPALAAALEDPTTHNDARNAIGRVWYAGTPGDENSLFAESIESAVPALQRAMKNDDPRTRGVVAALLCRMIHYCALEQLTVPRALRAAVPTIRERLGDPSPLVRRYVLIEVLNERPTELLTPVYCDLLRRINEAKSERSAEY
jgi:HEAT repeat protein